MEDELSLVSEKVSILIELQDEIVKVLDTVKKAMQTQGELDKVIVTKLMELDTTINNVYDSDMS